MPDTNYNNALNVTTGKPKTTGAVYRAPLGTTLPTDPTTALASGFVCTGYISDDGVVNSNSPESESVKAWGGDEVLHTQTGKKDTFKFTLLEAQNENALKNVYGDSNVSATAATTSSPKLITVTANSTELPECSYVIETIMKNNGIKRIVIPCGKVTNVGDITYKDGSALGYELTISAIPDDSGATHYEYLSVGSALPNT